MVLADALATGVDIASAHLQKLKLWIEGPDRLTLPVKVMVSLVVAVHTSRMVSCADPSLVEATNLEIYPCFFQCVENSRNCLVFQDNALRVVGTFVDLLLMCGGIVAIVS